MDKKILISTNDSIFATGVFLQPMRFILDGKEQWGWVASSFEDDSYYNGETVNPTESSDKLEDLLESFDLD